MRKILFVTLPGGHFWSYGPAWSNVDMASILDRFRGMGYVATAVEVTNLLQENLAKDDLVVYTSSDNPELRQYVKDIIYIASKICHVIPGYEGLLAHENKGFQQIFRRYRGFGALEGEYGVNQDLLNANLPYVFKTIGGAGSSGVELVNSPDDIARLKKKHFSGASVKRRLVNTYRRLVLSSEDFARYSKRRAAYTASIRQNFVPNLDCDYKVLVFGERLFVLRRGVRGGDFRASGSGRFSFSSPPASVLEFGANVHACLNSPYSSLDVAVSDEGIPSLLEYQCVSFGPYTVINSPGYYFRDDGGWRYQKINTTLEEAIVHAIENFLERSILGGA